jgi:hypothetical protein
MCILPEVRHVSFVVTFITPVHNGLLVILPSLAIFPSSTILCANRVHLCVLYGSENK